MMTSLGGTPGGPAARSQRVQAGTCSRSAPVEKDLSVLPGRESKGGASTGSA
ncbi:MAG: hypothetical protein ABIJ09_10955 [Pseudomonadota bacterium]